MDTFVFFSKINDLKIQVYAKFIDKSSGPHLNRSTVGYVTKKGIVATVHAGPRSVASVAKVAANCRHSTANL